MRGVHAKGDAVRQLRKSFALTQAQLAERAGCDVKTIHAAERGHSLDIFILRSIATALGVHYADVAREGKRHESKELLNIKLVHDWLQAVDDCDVAALTEAFGPHGVLRVPGSPELSVAGTFRGHQKLRDHWEALLTTFAVKRLARAKCTLSAIDDLVHLCGFVMLEYRARRATCRLEVALAFRFEKERIAELTVYCDTLAIHRLTGSQPPAGATSR